MSEIGVIASTGIGLILLWVLFYFGVRPYRVDRIRHELFVLRDEMFMYAMQGGISFEDQAYRMLRNKINALIRYAHTVTFTRIVIFGSVYKSTIKSHAASQRMKWDEEVQLLPKSQRDVLKDIDNRIQIILFRHIVYGNPITLLTCMAAFFVIGRHGQQAAQLKKAREWKIDIIEEQASVAQAQKLDRDRELQMA